MAFAKKTVKDLNLKNKTVLVRVDYNVPVDEDGRPTDLYRVKSSVSTIQYLLQQGCRIILISHLGRPEGKRVQKYSLKPITKELSKLLNHPVEFADECIGPAVESKAKGLKPKGILLLENLRFHAQEEKNDNDFAKQLAGLAEVFVQDGFGVVHRAHASTDAITKHLPSVAGLLLEREVSAITDAMNKPKRPLVAILGGAKVSDKIELLERLIDKADFVAIGGAMANTFLKFDGKNIGKSIYEEGQESQVKRIKTKLDAKAKAMAKDFVTMDDLFVVLPEFGPVAVAKKISKDQRRNEIELGKIAADEYILDNDPSYTFRFVEDAGTVIWNGPLGITEIPQFAEGSNKLALAIKRSKAVSIIGGGDTAAFILGWDPDAGKGFDLVSTGGGSGLELMAGKKLPGVEALLDK